MYPAGKTISDSYRKVILVFKIEFIYVILSNLVINLSLLSKILNAFDERFVPMKFF